MSYFTSKLNLSLLIGLVVQVVSLLTGETKPTAETITPVVANALGLAFRVQDEQQKRAAQKR